MCTGVNGALQQDSREVMVPFMALESAVALNEE